MHPFRLATAVRTHHHQLPGAGRDADYTARRPHPFHLHRIQVRRHDPYEVITLADTAATRDGALPAHGGTLELHGNLARATIICTRTSAPTATADEPPAPSRRSTAKPLQPPYGHALPLPPERSRLGRSDRFPAVLSGPQGGGLTPIRVGCLVRSDSAGPGARAADRATHPDALQHRVEAGAVGGLSRGEDERQGPAPAFGREVGLAGQPARERPISAARSRAMRRRRKRRRSSHATSSPTSPDGLPVRFACFDSLGPATWASAQGTPGCSRCRERPRHGCSSRCVPPRRAPRY